MVAMALSSVNAVRPAMVSATRPRARVAARVAYAKPVVGLGAGKSLRVARRAASSLRVSAAAEEAEAIKKGEENEEEGSGVRQLLGIRGGEQTTDIWKIRLQLTKPVTWVPLIWGVLCGAAASGHFTWTPENVGKSMLCMFMSGPLLTGTIARATNPANPAPADPEISRIPIPSSSAGPSPSARATPTTTTPPKTAMFDPALTSSRPVSFPPVTAQATPRPSTIGTTARSTPSTSPTAPSPPAPSPSLTSRFRCTRSSSAVGPRRGPSTSGASTTGPW